MPSDIGYKAAFVNFSGPGGTVLVSPKPWPSVVHALCATVNLDCELTFGWKEPASGFGTATPVTCTFYVKAGTPLVLPFTEDGWFGFPDGKDIVAAAMGAAANVGVQVVYARAGV
jgi:hypothetical protein